MDIRFAHIGWAVKNINSAVESFAVLGYKPIGNICHDVQRNVALILLKDKSDAVIELVAPEADDSPVSDILKKNGPTPYHICCSISKDDWGGGEIFKKNGFMILHQQQKAPLFGNKDVVFLYSSNIGVIELILQ